MAGGMGATCVCVCACVCVCVCVVCVCVRVCCGDGVDVGDRARLEPGTGVLHGDGTRRTDGMRGDGVGVGDIIAVPGGAWCVCVCVCVQGWGDSREGKGLPLGNFLGAKRLKALEQMQRTCLPSSRHSSPRATRGADHTLAAAPRCARS